MFANRKEGNLIEIAVSVPRFKHYRDGQTIFSSFAAENGTPFTLTGVGDPVLVNGGRVTSNYFDTLGVHPIRGRAFLPNDVHSGFGQYSPGRIGKMIERSRRCMHQIVKPDP